MSKWNNRNHPAYWNRLLKDEGLGVIKGRQVIRKRRPGAAAQASTTTSSRKPKPRRKAA